jgi:hypothetical protein
MPEHRVYLVSQPVFVQREIPLPTVSDMQKSDEKRDDTGAAILPTHLDIREESENNIAMIIIAIHMYADDHANRKNDEKYPSSLESIPISVFQRQ